MYDNRGQARFWWRWVIPDIHMFDWLRPHGNIGVFTHEHYLFFFRRLSYGGGRSWRSWDAGAAFCPKWWRFSLHHIMSVSFLVPLTCAFFLPKLAPRQSLRSCTNSPLVPQCLSSFPSWALACLFLSRLPPPHLIFFLFQVLPLAPLWQLFARPTLAAARSCQSVCAWRRNPFAIDCILQSSFGPSWHQLEPFPSAVSFTQTAGWDGHMRFSWAMLHAVSQVGNIQSFVQDELSRQQGKEYNKHLMCRATPAQYTLHWETTTAQLRAMSDKLTQFIPCWPKTTHAWTQLERILESLKHSLKHYESQPEYRVYRLIRTHPKE